MSAEGKTKIAVVTGDVTPHAGVRESMGCPPRHRGGLSGLVLSLESASPLGTQILCIRCKVDYSVSGCR